VVGRDHGVEFTAHGAHEHRVRREWPGDFRRSRSGSENIGVFVAESSRIARVRVESAECNPWLGDPEPLSQSFARDARRLGYRFGAQ